MLVVATNAHTLLDGGHVGDAGGGDQFMFAVRPRESLTCAGDVHGYGCGCVRRLWGPCHLVVKSVLDDCFTDRY